MSDSRTFAPELAVKTPGWNDFANLTQAETQELRDLLLRGAKRKLLRRKLWRWEI